MISDWQSEPWVETALRNTEFFSSFKVPRELRQGELSPVLIIKLSLPGTQVSHGLQ